MRALPFLAILPLVFGPIIRVAFVGDSVTLGIDDPTGGYVRRIARGMPIEAERFVKYHLADALLDWHEVEAFEPNVIVIELGAHAVVGCDHLPAHDLNIFRDRYEALLKHATQKDRRVAVVEIPWLGWEDDTRAREYNEILYKLAELYGVDVILVYDMLAACGRECLSVDGVHPNMIGHEKIAQAVMETIR